MRNNTDNKFQRLSDEQLQGKQAFDHAKDLNEYASFLPELEVGDIVEMNDLWNGAGEVPEESFSIALNDMDYINYCFIILEPKENPLDTVIQITKIELL